MFYLNVEKRMTEVSKLSENTSLQKSAKKYLANGGKFGVGVGVIKREKF